MTDDDTPDAFTVPTDIFHPATIAARLMRLPELAHLAEHEVQFGWLVRGTPKEKGGKTELGSVHVVKTMFQGAFKDMCLMLLERMLGFLPEFLIVIDAGFWAQANDRDKEALVYHELLHIRQSLDQFGALKFNKDGFPVWQIVGHDVEAFNDEVRRYGAWHDGISQFIAAADCG